MSPEPPRPGATAADATAVPAAVRAGAEVEDVVLRAAATAPGTRDALGSALRTGILRRRGAGPVAGLCAALAEAGGVPVRLVRLTALGLLLLGVGLPLYLALALVVPREGVADADASSLRPAVDRPVVAILSGRARTGDVLLALALVPSVLVAGAWGLALVRVEPAPVWLLAPVEAAALLVLGWAAVRARRARSAYLFAEMAHRAGILDQGELRRTVEDLRRTAPVAWGASGDPRISGTPARRSRTGARGASPRARPLGARGSIAVLGGLVAIGTLAFGAVSLEPDLAPGLATASHLPGIGRVATAAGVTAAAAGVLLIALGLLRRSSAVGVLAGLLALSVLAGGVVWVRLTDDTGAAPIVVAPEAYIPGYEDVCPDEAATWNRPVVLDLSGLAADRREMIDRWRTEHPDAPDSQMNQSMYLACDRIAGDVTVLLPPGSGTDRVPVILDLDSRFGHVDGARAVPAVDWQTESPVIIVGGQLLTGDVTYVEAAP